jgi:hypothetical protein
VEHFVVVVVVVVGGGVGAAAAATLVVVVVVSVARCNSTCGKHFHFAEFSGFVLIWKLLRVNKALLLMM